MDIIDVHAHVSLDKEAQIFSDYDFKVFQSDRKKNGVKKSVIFLNPFIKNLLCPRAHNHKIKVLDSTVYGYLKLYCTVCRNVYYEGIDPLRRLNEEIINCSRSDSSLLPFIFVNISKTSTVYEINYFESKYGNKVKGYKMHPALSNRQICELGELPTAKPIIVHTGVGQQENPSNVIRFSEHYKGNIVLSHFAKFDECALNEVKKNERLFIDSSPSNFIFNQYLYKPHKLFDTNYLTGFVSWVDMMNKIFKFMGSEKIIFGSDVPWGDMTSEIASIYNSGFSKQLLDNYLYNNANRFIGI